jgi:hypothetical protein
MKVRERFRRLLWRLEVVDGLLPHDRERINERKPPFSLSVLTPIIVVVAGGGGVAAVPIFMFMYLC